MAGTKDYYRELELARAASAEDVRAAYRRLALTWHAANPHGNSDLGPESTRAARFAAVAEAYDVLGTRASRITPLLFSLPPALQNTGRKIAQKQTRRRSIGRTPPEFAVYTPENESLSLGGACACVPGCGPGTPGDRHFPRSPHPTLPRATSFQSTS